MTARTGPAPIANDSEAGSRVGALSTGLVAITIAIVAALTFAAAAGLLRPLDNGLTDHRFNLVNHAPSGSVVMVEIDPASLRSVGTWPWPRHVYANLLDRLMEMGAAETVFDIDFSSASSEAEDRAFADALDRAGGYAFLAAFRQFSPVTGQMEVTLPLARFAALAEPVAVNVVSEQDGVVRRYPAGIDAGGKHYRSLAETLAGGTLASAQPVFIDYGIDASAIDRMSVADVLAGRVDPRRLTGKQVVIAATAQELRDYFTVPRFGPIPGGLLQILASETLKQPRQLQSTGWLVSALLTGAVGLLFLLLYNRAPLRVVVAAGLLAAMLVEGMALLLQARFGILLRTASIDIGLAALLALAVVEELARKRQQHRAAAHERDAMQRILNRVIADNFDGVVVMDEHGIIIAASAMAEGLLGRGAILTGRSAGAVLPEGFAAGVSQARAGENASIGPTEVTLDIASQRRSFEFVVTRSNVASVDGGDRPVICLTFRDISERRRSEERLAFLAIHDALTGALRRLPFVDTVERALEGDAARDQGLTLLVLDLSRFRVINDTLGHAFGDQVMKEVVARLNQLDLLAVGRVGGDSFAVARRGLFSPDDATAFGAEVIDRLIEPYEFDGRRAVLSASAGLTDTRRSGYSGDTLLSHADMALSNTGHGNNFELFTPAMLQRVNQRQELESALRRAIADGRIDIHYQPQVRLDTGELVGAEALMRWHDEKLGHISPARFMPLAEETGLIVELGRFALQAACREVASWPETIRLAVNISPVQFALADMVQDVSGALAASGLAPRRLDVEITEGVLVAENHPALLALDRIRRLGVGVAIDDFGTGYSSLSYLSRLPVDKLKVDQSFIRDLLSDEAKLPVVRAVLTLAQDLGKMTIAEGIESEGQAELLREFGCDIGQGYLFGKAMPAAELRARYFDQPARRALAS